MENIVKISVRWIDVGSGENELKERKKPYIVKKRDE